MSVGSNYPDKAMHFQLDQVRILQGVEYRVSRLERNQEMFTMGKLGYDIFLSNKDGTILWKTLVDMPTVIENNIDFD